MTDKIFLAVFLLVVPLSAVELFQVWQGVKPAPLLWGLFFVVGNAFFAVEFWLKVFPGKDPN